MPTPKNCMSCQYQYRCNTAMYSKGCGYYPPKSEVKETNPLKRFFGKFFR